jgi:uncharacterized protein GlcG (DUF336 family)
MKRIYPGILAACLAMGAAHAWAQDRPYVTMRSLTAPMASRLALAAFEDCAAKGYQVAVAVVARDGRLLALVRSPLAGPHTAEVSEGKAYSAATFRAATGRLMADDFMRDFPDVVIVGGGLPIDLGGHFYRGVGVSGAPQREKPGDVDEVCAAAGIEAIADEIELGGD